MQLSLSFFSIELVSLLQGVNGFFLGGEGVERRVKFIINFLLFHFYYKSPKP
jgi:hypothetical protein